jgi:hypothetical protein
MAQNLDETLPSWSELPASNRRRLAVLLGRLVQRQLLPSSDEPAGGAMADERDPEPRKQRDAVQQDPGASP